MSGEPRFNVIFRGEAQEGFDPDQVRKSLAEKYERSPESLARLFTGEPYVIGTNRSATQARELSDTLEQLGLLVYLEEIGLPARPAEPDRVPEPKPRQNAAPEAEPVHAAEEDDAMPPPSWRSRFRYGFDTYMARGGSSIFKGLVVTFLSLFLLIGVTRGVFQWLVPGAGLQYGELDFWGNLYISFLQLTDPGNMAQDIQSSPHYKIFAVLAGLSGVIMLSALIAFITTALDQKISALKRGHSKVIESGHTLILGWNEQRIVEILRELVLANESESDACVVILADMDKEEMDDSLRLRLSDTCSTRLVTRSGSATTLANLDLVSIESCGSAIILARCGDTASSEEKAASDAMVIQTILAVDSKSPDDDFSIVAEIYDSTHRDVVGETFGDRIVTVNTSEVLAKLLVQTSRSVGLSTVYNEILSFDGCEMYFYDAEWGDRSFEEIAYHFPDGVPIGLRHADGRLTLNPPGSYRMLSDDEILIVADDDSTIEFRPDALIRPRSFELAGGRLSQGVERELVLGWNRKAPIILREFADYVKPGSRVDVMLKEPTDAQRLTIEGLDAELESLEVRVLEADCMSREGLLTARPFEYDNIIILAGADDASVDVAQVDSENIVTLLLLRSIFRDHPEESRGTKLITEVLDSQNHSLVARAGVKDVIISNRLVSMIMAQVSESRDIRRVYDDLFSEDGSEIYLKPASLYFDQFPVSLRFADLIGIARKRDEVCIGFKRKALESDNERNNGVQLIPEKNTGFEVQRDDCLIVLAEDEL